MPAPSAVGLGAGALTVASPRGRPDGAASASPSRTRARRTPQSHCRACCAFAGGTPKRLTSASWKPSGRLPGPRSSSLSVDSPAPAPAVICAPSSASKPPAPASLACLCKRARAHLCRSLSRTKAALSWMSPATSKWLRRSVVFSSSPISSIRCNELIQSAERSTTRTMAWEFFCRARHAHIAQNLALIRTHPPQMNKPISGPCGSMLASGK
mmetsp:Transcript_114792/g.335699  ORF Transcript_114792/g.335699 Transcript_114792/m.335699 type:complete len:212 (-) Transcript_114792:610-1245(-)